MASSTSKWERLERLRGLLLGGEPTTAAQLAEALRVSLRTTMRDLDALRDSGVLIEADPGRGGGVRIASGHGGGRVSLGFDEALDLLVAIAVAEKLNTPAAQHSLRAAREKLSLLFAPAHRESIRTLRRRILVGTAASARIAAEFDMRKARHAQVLRRAFTERRCLNLSYSDQAGRVTIRTAEPQFLLLNPPAWYVLAWDRLRDGVRAFRVDRIASASVLEERFGLRPSGVFLAAVEAGVESL
jgi:predicted DNA-binding transcriptional regulator YafY